MKKGLTLCVLLVFLLCACSAANQPQQATNTPQTTDEQAQLTDMMDRQVSAVTSPKHIISLSASNTEILFALGLGDKIVGLDQYSDYPAETADIEKVGDYTNPNIEAIAALEPEIVFTSNKMQRDTIDSLEALGINIAAIEATTYDEIDDSILLIGQLTGTQDAAQELVDAMNAEQARIIALDRPQQELSCYYILSAGEYGNWTSGPGSFVNDMMEMLGIRPVTDIQVSAPWMDFSLETLVASDPDVLLLSTDAYLTVDDLAAMDGYSDLTAVKEGRVVMIDPDLLNPGPRIVEGLQAMYDAVYGS